jgi:hypothetical protein
MEILEDLEPFSNEASASGAASQPVGVHEAPLILLPLGMFKCNKASWETKQSSLMG